MSRSATNNHAFLYDLYGNQAGWNATDSKQNRVIVWDEDNRMQSVTDSSAQPTTFKYDDNTNRVVKKGAGGETLYINPWYVAALGRNSKQVFAGKTRIVTKLEQFPSGEGYGTGAKNLTEVYQYFYHQDNLGSTGFATDATGEVYQHLEYFPFGETWVDEVSDDTRVPYRFTGQEWDPETRLYYYGARYFDPRTSVWQNPDPIIGSYLKAKAGHGVFQPNNINLYAYARKNPIIIIDPDGLCTQEDGCHVIDPRFDPERVRADMDRIGDFAVGFVPGSNYLDARRNWNEGRYGWATFHAVVGTGDVALSVVTLGGVAAVEGVVKGGVKAGVKQIGKTAAEDVAKATVEGTTRESIKVTKSGVALPAEGKYTIPGEYVQNPHRSGSFGEVVDGKFKERLRIAPLYLSHTVCWRHAASRAQ